MKFDDQASVTLFIFQLQIRDNLDKRKDFDAVTDSTEEPQPSAFWVAESVNKLIDRTNQLEEVVSRYSIINTGLLSTLLVIVPLVSWLLSK